MSCQTWVLCKRLRFISVTNFSTKLSNIAGSRTILKALYCLDKGLFSTCTKRDGKINLPESERQKKIVRYNIQKEMNSTNTLLRGSNLYWVEYINEYQSSSHNFLLTLSEYTVVKQ